ncbi:hypothetical protein QE152_g12416 [Popillia japonica]|uniref:Uncharacterized protein n=1 Tax=Popillia japonica TaxID=7064 RepID=A0AAW1LRZ9_POPJA
MAQHLYHVAYMAQCHWHISHLAVNMHTGKAENIQATTTESDDEKINKIQRNRRTAPYNARENLLVQNNQYFNK